MLQKEANTSPLLKPQSKSHKPKNQSIIIIAIAVIASLVILSIGSSLQLSSSRLYQWFSGQQIGQKGRKNAAVLMKIPKIIEEATPTLIKIDKNNKYLINFTINGPQITYTGPTQRWTQLLAYKPICYNQTFHIRLSPTFSPNSHILLGVTTSHRNSSQSSFFSSQTYAYYGHNGCLWAEGELLLKDGLGFREGETVDMEVQLWEGLVQWKVGGVVRAQIYSERLQRGEGEFFVYLEMFEKNDSVRFVL